MRYPKLLTLAAGAAFLTAAGVGAADKQVLRPQIEKPVLAAQVELQNKQYQNALGKLTEAESVGKLSPYETYTLNRLRGAVLIGQGNVDDGIAALETALASGGSPAEDQLSNFETLAKLNYGAKHYAKAIDYLQKYSGAGGNNAALAGLLPQALYLDGRYAEATPALIAQLDSLEKTGQRPTEIQLQLLASSALKQNDMSTYSSTLERLVTYYPKDSYWLDLIARTSTKPGFSERLDLDVYRLRLKTGTLGKASDYVQAAELALQAGLPGEADQILKQGVDAKLLGNGGDAASENRLKDQVARKIKEDKATLVEGEKAAAAQASGDALVATGLNYVGYGDYAKGLPLIEEGIRKGKLKRPGEANLHLGYAYLLSGQREQAIAAFKAVQDSDGSQDLARLWTIQARRS